jgi:hypothetical protein
VAPLFSHDGGRHAERREGGVKVIRGKHDGDTVFVFSADKNRSGFEIADELGLEGIRFGESTAYFVHVWHSDVQVEPELTNRILRKLPDDLALALTIDRRVGQLRF